MVTTKAAVIANQMIPFFLMLFTFSRCRLDVQAEQSATEWRSIWTLPCAVSPSVGRPFPSRGGNGAKQQRFLIFGLLPDAIAQPIMSLDQNAGVHKLIKDFQEQVGIRRDALRTDF